MHTSGWRSEQNRVFCYPDMVPLAWEVRSTMDLEDEAPMDDVVPAAALNGLDDPLPWVQDLETRSVGTCHVRCRAGLLRD